ncbi:ubiquinol oxidase subunit II [Undibacterium sp. RTI2.1]|uniref:ubiquinol oxidase subunit II n=1 Tax=unclassified Undibacterium TaxID=2630295 RepID=UPI002AB43C39|nr:MULTISPECIES: ubiquinol oxidase subunit II [unclassified Undibacterium]MDY7537274.1 ubiquinol oxidase subunit II [Undibacterium sp. 5I1]MEB0031833.1 ubiquinol oxidase subunit II [Undibacterium sp. RTI2.1]MEB0117543.1 ubiquinol oxidase subunit II [Undibacterium sp. RTI2.2]MEB0230313.1 ubiquinol oxidase subunit II [Undibacterium sp. 10I3]MEB0258177.1 ubiquinol oxidase subunit II [Undibacterium sp. 5I1]
MIPLFARRGLALLPAVLLAGCNTVVMNPSGDIAAQQSHLIWVSTLLMLLIIVPVIILTIVFAWRYRKSNTAATYEPDWDHSTQLELVIWGAPLLIIIALGLITWISTHTLDPYRKLSRLDENRPIPMGTKTLNVEVVALDWKWLFIYPDLGIATVNELAAPVDVPVHFKITASSVMNSFFIPALAGQIYAMPGMETSLNAVINKPGEFEGFSANYSGAGFSDMRFKFHGMSAKNFDLWVQATKAKAQTLDRANYLELEKPSQRDPVRHYASVDADLYHAILNRCVGAGEVCMDKMMMSDARANAKAYAASNAKADFTSIFTQRLKQDNATRLSFNIDAEICTASPLTIGKQ